MKADGKGVKELYWYIDVLGSENIVRVEVTCWQRADGYLRFKYLKPCLFFFFLIELKYIQRQCLFRIF